MNETDIFNEKLFRNENRQKTFDGRGIFARFLTDFWISSELEDYFIYFQYQFIEFHDDKSKNCVNKSFGI